MKFTKQEFSEKLKNKLTDDGKKKLVQSERTFNSMVERIYRRLENADDETELDDAVSEYLPDFEDVEGNMRHDNADFAKTYKEQWEKEHPQDGKGKNTRQKKEDDDDPDDRYTILLQKLEAIEKRDEERRTSELVAEKKNAIRSRLAEKGVKDERWIAGMFDIMTVNADTDEEALADKVLKAYNRMEADTNEPVTPKSAKGGSSKIDLSYLD